MTEFIEGQISEGGYNSASEYFRELVRDDQKRKAQEKLEQLLIEGLESGHRITVTPEYMQKKKDELIARHKGRKTA